MSLTSNSSTSMNKRFKSGNIVDASILHKISNQIIELQTMFNNKIASLENKLDLLVTCYSEVMERLENEDISCSSGSIKSSLIRNSTVRMDEDEERKCCKETLNKLSNIEDMINKIFMLAGRATPIDSSSNGKKPDDGSFLTVLLPQKKPKVEAQLGLDSNMQVITLNSESDYPDGSWLGDENNLESRVRVPITPAQLLHINTHCTTPAKMAIVLVDYLFPKEVLATSNLSGKGRHCKKQLDPLMIYGIRSHLLYKFKITEKDWYRIKQNIDSKCRTAWRKKIRGILGENKNPMFNSLNRTSDSEAQDGSHSNKQPFVLSTNSLSSEEVTEDTDSGILRTSKGHFKIVRATPEQVARLQERHTLKVFTNEDVAEMFPPSQMFSVEDMDGYTLTGCGDEQTLTIVTENGEVSIPISTEDSLGSDHQFISTDHLDDDKKFIVA